MKREGYANGSKVHLFVKQRETTLNNLKSSLYSGWFSAIIFKLIYALFNDLYTGDENVLKANTPKERQQAVNTTIDLCIE